VVEQDGGVRVAGPRVGERAIGFAVARTEHRFADVRLLHELKSDGGPDA
jgi:hypothetical protein